MALSYRFRGRLGRPSSALQTALARVAAMSAATVSIAAAVPAAAQPAENAQSADAVQRPGDALRFVPCTPEQAHQAMREQRQRLQRIALAIHARSQAHA